MFAHEYDPRESAALLIEESVPIPGRVRITFGDDHQETSSFHLNESLLIRVVEKYLAQKRKAKPVEATDGTRKTRTPITSVDDL
jgi:hypothetical protein